jgi:hypothetical protein
MSLIHHKFKNIVIRITMSKEVEIAVYSVMFALKPEQAYKRNIWNEEKEIQLLSNADPHIPTCIFVGA